MVNNNFIYFSLIAIVIGYLFGSLMWSIIIGKLFFGKDPRDYNSKNPGATNSSRIYGKKVALIVLLLDILKAIIPMIVCWVIGLYAFKLNEQVTYEFNPMSLTYFAGFFAIIGHMFPVFFKFKGGKGIATFGGFLIASAPFLALFQLLILIGLVIISKYVSLSSLISTILTCILIFIPGLNYSFILCDNINQLLTVNYGSVYWLLVVWSFIVVATILIFIKHRKNIISLVHRTERKFYLLKKKSEKELSYAN